VLEFLGTEPEKKARTDLAAQAGPQGLPGETLATRWRRGTGRDKPPGTLGVLQRVRKGPRSGRR